MMSLMQEEFSCQRNHGREQRTHPLSLCDMEIIVDNDVINQTRGWIEFCEMIREAEWSQVLTNVNLMEILNHHEVH